MAVGVVKQSSPRSSALVFLSVGVLSGVSAKLVDGWDVPVVTDLVANLGLWILVVTLIGSMSSSRSFSIVRVVAFLVGMLSGYFACSAWLFDYFPQGYALGWLAVALILGAPFALIVWYSRGAGWVSACAAAIPIGMLLLTALPSLLVQQPRGVAVPVSRFDVVTWFNPLAAVTLGYFLPRGNLQRVRSLVLALPLGFVVSMALRFVTL